MITTEDAAARTRWAGSLALGAAVVSAFVLAIPGGAEVLWEPAASLYTPGHWVLCAVLAACGIALRNAPPSRHGAAATAGVLAAGQLCATGIWAIKHWEPFSGMNGTGYDMLPPLRALAAVLVAANATAVAGCVVALRRSGAWQPAEPGVRRWAPVAAGALVAAGLPVALLGGLTPITMFGTIGLLFSLPWGAAVAATGLLRRDAAITAGLVATIAPPAVVAWQLAWHFYYDLGWRPYLLALLALLAVAAVAAAATAAARRRPRPAAPSPS